MSDVSSPGRPPEDESDSTLQQLRAAMHAVDAYYRKRGIFQDRFGLGTSPAVIVVDFAYGWTDDAYAGGSRRLDGPVEQTGRLLRAAREKAVPIVYTTSTFRPHTPDEPFKSAADKSADFRPWDERAVEIDHRVAPAPEDLILEKENASAFFGTHLVSYLIERRVDTVLITGCSTSACIRATATDAKSYRFRPIIVEECVGDRAEAAHIFTLFDIQARFADVRPLREVLQYLANLPGTESDAVGART